VLLRDPIEAVYVAAHQFSNPSKLWRPAVAYGQCFNDLPILLSN